MTAQLDSLDVLYLALLGCMRLTRRKTSTRVDDLKGQRFQGVARGEVRHQEVAPRISVESVRRRVSESDVINVVVAFVDNDRYTRATTYPWRMDNTTAGKSTAERPVIVREEARLLQADNVCLFEQRLDVGDNVMSARKAV